MSSTYGWLLLCWGKVDCNPVSGHAATSPFTPCSNRTAPCLILTAGSIFPQQVDWSIWPPRSPDLTCLDFISRTNLLFLMCHRELRFMILGAVMSFHDDIHVEREKRLRADGTCTASPLENVWIGTWILCQSCGVIRSALWDINN
jgi:hypothetical protein